MLASEIHTPRDLGSLLSLMQKNPEALILAGGTDILREQGMRTVNFPPVVIAVHEIPEMGKLILTERFLEIGACVTLAELETYNPAAMQPALISSIRGIATLPIRNLATIGGNIASKLRFMDLWPVLACLDSLVEIRNSSGARWININRFSDDVGAPSIPQEIVLTRLRIPLERWDVNVVVKVGQADYPTSDSAVFVVTARIGKGIVNDFHLVMAGEHCFRSRELESAVIGRKLPIPEHEMHLLANEYRAQYGSSAGSVRAGMGRLPELAFKMLAR